MRTLLRILTTLVIHVTACTAYITYIEIRYPIPGEPSPPGSPWPYPQIYRPTPDLLTVHPTRFTFTVSSTAGDLRHCDVLHKAFRRYRFLMFQDASVSSDDDLSEIRELDVQPLLDRSEVTCEEKYPSLDSEEMYEMEIKPGKSILRAASQWGVLRGLETFSQVVYISDDNHYRVNESSISDFPRFRHRGILMDTARHYQPLRIIKKNLDAMAYNKFNVFHWHIVDDQSFPYESVTFPELSQKGAYSQRMTYSQADVAEVVEYARLRGIRVIPEFDTPGHTQSWGLSHPELITPCWADGRPYQRNGTYHAESEMLNPILDTTYQFMRDILGEVARVFPDDYMHLGMDEAYYYCWQSNPNITQFMAEHNMTAGDYSQLEQYYAQRVLDMVSSLGKNYIVWQDPVDNGAELQEGAIIQVWKQKSDIMPTADKGYRMILSAGWYLNYISYPDDWLEPDWKSYYTNDPQDFPGTIEQQNNMIGGEACLWAEYQDQTNILPTLWPRASAVAERLWSSKHWNNSEDAAYRLDEQRCRMLRRGIPAKPILNGYCGDWELDLVDGDHRELENAADSSSRSADHVELVACLLLSLLLALG